MSKGFENTLAIVSIIIAFSYFGYRLFWGSKWIAAVIKRDKEKQENASSRSVDIIVFSLLLAGSFIVLLYNFLKA